MSLTVADMLAQMSASRINHFRNDQVQDRAPYPDAHRGFLTPEIAAQVRRDISSWEGYRSTPLHNLEELAQAIGIEAILYKDEAPRFTLRSFKALGGAYAVDQLLLRELPKRVGDAVTQEQLNSGDFADECSGITIATATDGNHGRSVAWGAKRRGCPCQIYVHEGVSEGRREALRSFGAKVIVVEGNYDDSVHRAKADAAASGWFVVSDTSYPGYTQPPTDVMRGYTVMTGEVVDQLGSGPVPTHVFVQGGVGGLAAAVLAHLWTVYETERPRFVIVEPELADCLYQSAIQGSPFDVKGDLGTMMAGLACGEVSELAWPIIHDGAADFVTLPDATVPLAMRYLAQADIEAGESAVAGLCALLCAAQKAPLRERLGLTEESRVLLFGTEGATDPELYTQITGKPVQMNA
ncbi:MAG: diaminopropionate ammonia-lyase [Erythrobacter sp.]|uniref:diaminopropionate ammonia-lyase n=1 Tax=Erythrobacter sp. TaxID=1042 RepID=UPI002617C406|nr:diaminopropionate ammonia-lyase [Erythrobacter sp.]MDJ0978129.1 diaminopropionate ammonia-lyase [Erythrobacter sp.]